VLAEGLFLPDPAESVVGDIRTVVARADALGDGEAGAEARAEAVGAAGRAAAGAVLAAVEHARRRGGVSRARLVRVFFLCPRAHPPFFFTVAKSPHSHNNNNNTAPTHTQPLLVHDSLPSPRHDACAPPTSPPLFLLLLRLLPRFSRTLSFRVLADLTPALLEGPAARAPLLAPPLWWSGEEGWDEGGGEGGEGGAPPPSAAALAGSAVGWEVALASFLLGCGARAGAAVEPPCAYEAVPPARAGGGLAASEAAGAAPQRDGGPVEEGSEGDAVYARGERLLLLLVAASVGEAADGWRCVNTPLFRSARAA
jgi:hypothetical protein